MDKKLQWGQINLRQFLEFIEVAKAIPDDFLEARKIEDDKEREKAFEKVNAVDLLEWQAACIYNLRDVEKAKLSKSTPEQIGKWFDNISHIVDGAILGYPTEQMPYLKKVALGGVDYYAPKSEKSTAYTLDEPLQNATLGEFAEWQALKNSGAEVDEGIFESIPKQLAVIYKAKGETFHDIDFEKRAEMFREIDMASFWGCFFFLLTQRRHSLKHSRRFSEVKQALLAKRLESTGSRDTVGITP